MLLLLLICVSYPVLAGTNMAIGLAIGMQFQVHNLLVKKMPVLCKSVITTVWLPLLSYSMIASKVRTPLTIIKVISNNILKMILLNSSLKQFLQLQASLKVSVVM